MIIVLTLQFVEYDSPFYFWKQSVYTQILDMFNNHEDRHTL